MPNKNLQILMLEEDRDDRDLTEAIMQEIGFTQMPVFFSKKKELFQFLEQTDQPCLILIDYNLSSGNSIEVLQQLKEHKIFSKFPVVILSESILPKYVQESYALGAATFIKKPNTMQDTRKTIELFFRYWFEVAEL
jgi:CheY-like chemotaxis protein